MKPLLVATSIALASLAANAQCLPTPASAQPLVHTDLLRTAFAPDAAAPALPQPASAQAPQWRLLLTGLALMAGIALRRRGW